MPTYTPLAPRKPRVRMAAMPLLPPGFPPFEPGEENVEQYADSTIGPVTDLPAPSLRHWEANPKQALFINCPYDEVFFGGAKGGGKTVALLAHFCNHERKYGRSAQGIIFRRMYGEFMYLRRQASQMLEGIATWNAEFKAYVWPSGAMLRLAYLFRESDLGVYTGNEYTWIAYDELPEWASPRLFFWMFSCLRSTDPKVKKQVVSTGNPGRPGHGWVRQRYIDPMKPMEVYRDPRTGKTRCFIPARLEDNPHLYENDPEYGSNLDTAGSYDPQVIKALRYGVWDVFVGQAFAEWDVDRHIVPRREVTIRPEWPRLVTCDWGYDDPYAILYFAIAPDGHVYCYHEDYGCQEGEYDRGVRRAAYDVATDAYAYASAQGIETIHIDPQAKANQGVGSVFDQFQRAGWAVIEAVKDRIPGKNAVHALLQTDLLPDDRPILQVTDNCKHLIRTLPSLVYNERIMGKHEDVDDQGEDHLYDALRFLAMRHDMMPGSPRLRLPNTARRHVKTTWNPYQVANQQEWNRYGMAA